MLRAVVLHILVLARLRLLLLKHGLLGTFPLRLRLVVSLVPLETLMHQFPRFARLCATLLSDWECEYRYCSLRFCCPPSFSGAHCSRAKPPPHPLASAFNSP